MKRLAIGLIVAGAMVQTGCRCWEQCWGPPAQQPYYPAQQPCYQPCTPCVQPMTSCAPVTPCGPVAPATARPMLSSPPR
jgi:hypothetical protein